MIVINNIISTKEKLAVLRLIIEANEVLLQQYR
jgi:hypothetical protein